MCFFSHFSYNFSSFTYQHRTETENVGIIQVIIFYDFTVKHDLAIAVLEKR